MRSLDRCITLGAFLGIVTLVGCSSEHAPNVSPDAGASSPDGGGTGDSKWPSDAGLADSGEQPVDAGQPDAGEADAGFSAMAVCEQLIACGAVPADIGVCTARVTVTVDAFSNYAECATTEQDYEAWGDCLAAAPCSSDTDAGVAAVCPLLLAELERAAGQNATCLAILQAALGNSGADGGSPGGDGGFVWLADGG
jgi:hypothetical protein